MERCLLWYAYWKQCLSNCWYSRWILRNHFESSHGCCYESSPDCCYFRWKMKVAAKHDYDASQVQIASPKDLVDACLDAKKVLFVPGFGLAQSRGGPIVAEIMKDLQSRGIVVHFCVAGRMPGHMAVILAENSIPYELIFDLDELKGQFETYDVAIAIGCADTINPIAQESKDSNIAGMPICPVHHCKKAYVLKRSKRLDSGYSGEPLTLLVKENCRTVLGDARESLGAIQSKLNDVPKSNVSANTEMTVSITVEAKACDTPIQVSEKSLSPVNDIEFVEKKEGKQELLEMFQNNDRFHFVVVALFSVLVAIPKSLMILEMLLVLVLASIVGFFIIWSVPANLHSPLMSLSNGISGIVILGAMSLVGSDVVVANVLAIIAASAATINISGGLTVTYMMFQKITGSMGLTTWGVRKYGRSLFKPKQQTVFSEDLYIDVFKKCINKFNQRNSDFNHPPKTNSQKPFHIEGPKDPKTQETFKRMGSDPKLKNALKACLGFVRTINPNTTVVSLSAAVASLYSKGSNRHVRVAVTSAVTAIGTTILQNSGLSLTSIRRNPSRESVRLRASDLSEEETMGVLLRMIGDTVQLININYATEALVDGTIDGNPDYLIPNLISAFEVTNSENPITNVRDSVINGAVNAIIDHSEYHIRAYLTSGRGALLDISNTAIIHHDPKFAKNDNVNEYGEYIDVEPI
ncbi:hypothetical protein GEMRC1_012712 [Eukaryota sp. GEM-RC1]